MEINNGQKNKWLMLFGIKKNKGCDLINAHSFVNYFFFNNYFFLEKLFLYLNPQFN